MAKKISMDDIAKKIGVSKNTVSLALRGMPGISEQTRQLIVETARKMGYEYKGSTITDAPGNTLKNICFMMSKALRDSIGFFSNVQFGIEDEARRNNLNIIIHYFDDSQNNFEIPLSIKEGMISGIITLGRMSEKAAHEIIGFHLPTVMVDTYFHNIKIDCILTDNQCSGYMAAEYLIQCGHRKIGFLGAIQDAPSYYDRYQGYLKALRNYKLPVNDSVQLVSHSMEALLHKDLEFAVQKIQKLPELPTAFFCCNDAEAIALCKVLDAAGIDVPDDVSVMGFDDIDSARHFSPELTTMRVEKELMGKKATRRLIEIMNNPASLPEKILLSTQLIERQSVANIL